MVDCVGFQIGFHFFQACRSGLIELERIVADKHPVVVSVRFACSRGNCIDKQVVVVRLYGSLMACRLHFGFGENESVVCGRLEKGIALIS